MTYYYEYLPKENYRDFTIFLMFDQLRPSQVHYRIQFVDDQSVGNWFSGPFRDEGDALEDAKKVIDDWHVGGTPG